MGTAPDLAGWGSREWLIGMISNPAHERFYGDKNERMPIFAPHSEDSPENQLSPQNIGILADWLRGDWYEPTPPEATVAGANAAAK